MIIGFIKVDIENNAVDTHRDSYILDTLTVVSVRRPLLPFGLAFGAGLVGFSIAFGDLLFFHESVIGGAAGIAILVFTWHAGQLKLLSRDLRGSELGGAIWGRYEQLNAVRRDIVTALSANRKGKV